MALAEIIYRADHSGVVVQLGGADLKPFGKGRHHGGFHLGRNGVDEQLLLGAHAAADQDQLRVEDVHHACKALCDLVDPVVQHGLCAGVTGGSITLCGSSQMHVHWCDTAVQ